MLSVRESRSTAKLERMHIGLGALPYAAESVERADASFVQKEQTSCGGAMRSHDDDELAVHGDDARSDSSDETIELSPQSTGDCARFSYRTHRTPQPWRLVLTMICHLQRLALR